MQKVRRKGKGARRQEEVQSYLIQRARSNGSGAKKGFIASSCKQQETKGKE